MIMNLSKHKSISQPEHHLAGGVAVEVRNIHTDDNVRLAISRIKSRNGQAISVPVILVHGSYSTRRFWVSDKGIGLGVYLADQGFDVWIPELRGHGLSPKGESFSKITAEDQIRYDLPAIQDAVFNTTGTPAFWIGHSFGGLFILAALSMKWLSHDQVSGLITFGSQISLGDRYLKIPPVAWTLSTLLRVMGNFPAPKFGLGPEIESAGTMIETIRWKKFRGKWTNSEGGSYWDDLEKIKMPVLTYAAAIDKNDPPAGCRKIHKRLGSIDKMFMVLGKDTGFTKDYDHVGMVVSKEAQEEVWPDLAGWLKDRI
jgi:pimeloyl-ACP methyl ester carboxylesterase